MGRNRIAVVTGASSGIGAATARRLASSGFHVVVAARRADRLADLTAEINAAGNSTAGNSTAGNSTAGNSTAGNSTAGNSTAGNSTAGINAGGGAATATTCDVTSAESVRQLAETVEALDGDLAVLVNNAGGARGLDPVESGSVADWQWMFDVNVLGTLRVTQALLPALERGGAGTIVVVGSTAGFTVYEGGGGYAAAKHAATALVGTLRLELSGRPIRVIEIDPGLVRTEEFSLNRFGGDRASADAVYEGVREPLVAEDIADCVDWCVTRPQHVNIDRLVVRPIAQAAQHKVHRG